MLNVNLPAVHAINRQHFLNSDYPNKENLNQEYLRREFMKEQTNRELLNKELNKEQDKELIKRTQQTKLPVNERVKNDLVKNSLNSNRNSIKDSIIGSSVKDSSKNGSTNNCENSCSVLPSRSENHLAKKNYLNSNLISSNVKHGKQINVQNDHQSNKLQNSSKSSSNLLRIDLKNQSNSNCVSNLMVFNKSNSETKSSTKKQSKFFFVLKFELLF